MAKVAVGTYGFGTLVGYQAYEIKNRETDKLETRHCYYIQVTEEKNKETGLYSAVSVKEVSQTEQTLKTLKYGIPVKYKTVTSVYNGQLTERLSGVEDIM